MDARESGARRAGWLTVGLAVAGVAGVTAVAGTVHEASATVESTSDSATVPGFSGGDLSQGSGQAHAQSGGS
ncbi:MULTISPECIES: hypothetical protein [Amycolatopsis]|uniref:hypothetical protein n=1 Tax=Amycolatopsis TaxID=1813 RepID=UPI003659977E